MLLAAHCTTRSLLLLLAATAPVCAQTPPALDALARASAAEQAERHRAVVAAVDAIDAPYLRAMQKLTKSAGDATADRHQRLPVHHGKRVHASDEAPDSTMPQTVAYVFGVGAIDALDGKAAGKATDKPAKPTPEHARNTHLAEVHQALLGLPPGADRALATLLRQLDRDTGADRFAAFLHSWRNGKESFYEALDRTAGTKDSVFFYDAMLGDFRTTFGGKAADGSELPKSLQGAHDALHGAFLAYRQYRGFAEAVGWSLVLPPDVPLPRRLQRYEERAAGGYSLRQQVRMVASSLGDDPAAVTAAIVAGAPPLPQPIWSAGYDPYPAWNAVFTAHVPKMIDAAGSTDAFLAKAEADHRALATTIRTSAEQALAGAGKAQGH
jgi:hypothetical protein